MTNDAKARVCAVVGVGPGNGEAFARRFAEDGYAVALLARRAELTARLAGELPRARAYACDVADAASVEAAFAQIRADLGDPDVLVFNAGSGVWGSVEEVSRGGFRARLADQCAGSVPDRPAGDPGDASPWAGRHYRGRRHRLAPGRRRHGRFRARQGGPARPRRIDGAPSRPVGNPRRAHHRRRGRSVRRRRGRDTPTGRKTHSSRPRASPISRRAWSGRTARPGASKSRRGPTPRSGDVARFSPAAPAIAASRPGSRIQSPRARSGWARRDPYT